MSAEDRNSEALAALFGLFAEQLAPRVAAELVDRASSEHAVNGDSEPWRLLTLKDAAERLGRSERWVRERKEQIGYVRLDGGALAFDLDDLREFARGRRIGGQPWGRGGG